ncbi:putative damage-inducible protein DinB [Collimonas sp. PA-H2]|nr:DinB family protein [Collimonas sp. PA-H2]PFH09559.1 putative damage-inducible protein DinB [Collimonas sp. PA-H2]
MNSYFAALASYHLWATTKLLGHIDAISEEEYRRDCGLYFASIHGTLNHMLVGERNWYARIAKENSPIVPLDSELESERAALGNALAKASRRWSSWLATQPQQSYDGNLHYTRASGEPAVAPFMAVLGHVFNHATHHRGQITAALTAMGRACPELDFIYWAVAIQPTEIKQ